MNKSQFLSRIVPSLLDAGVSVQIEQKRILTGRFGGWFAAEPPCYALANTAKNSFDVAVHEYNHFLQWRDNRPFWDKYTDQLDDLFEALQNDGNVTDIMIDHTIRLEHDCEIRTLEMIDDLRLDINRVKYTKDTNAYLFSYHIMQHVGTWSQKSIYNVPLIISAMPDRLYGIDYYLDPNNMPENCIDRMIDLCFKRR